MKNITSRERVRKVLNKEIPDKIPIDFGGMRSTGIHVVAYQKLKEYLGINTSTKVYDIFQQLAKPEKEILEHFEADVVQLHRYAPAFDIKIDKWKEWKHPKGFFCQVPADFNPHINKKEGLEIRENNNVVARMPNNGYYFDQVYHPLAIAESISDIKNYNFPKINQEELSWLKKEGRKLYENTNFAILGEFGGNIFESGQLDFGYKKYYLELGEKSKMINYYHEKLSEIHLHNLKKYLDAVGNYIDIIQFGDDLGMQNNPQISTSMYKDLIKPYHSKLYKYVRNNYPDVKVFLHSCGSIYDLIPQLIDAGVEILNPVQLSANKMNPKNLKKEFGEKIIFWGGGCDTQTTLTDKTIKEIKQKVHDNIKVFGKNGGYVFTQVHNIQPNIDPKKIIAMYKTAIKNRDYN